MGLGMKIEINVLGPIKESELELEKGITIVYGPTSSGKSILLTTMTAIVYKKLTRESREFVRDLIAAYSPFREIKIRVDSIEINSIKALIETDLADKEYNYFPLYLSANRLASFYLSIPVFREVYKRASLSKIFKENVSAAIVEAIKDILKEHFRDLCKTPDNKYLMGLLYSLSSPTALDTALTYVMALGYTALDPELRENITGTFAKYFNHLGSLEVRKNTLFYKHTSGYNLPVLKSSDGIKEISYLLIVLEAFKQIPMFIAVDEIELHLYPPTLVKLLCYLLNTSKSSDKIFMFTSHNIFVMAWAIKQILKGEQVNLYLLRKRSDGYYKLEKPDLSKPIEGFEDLFMDLLRQHVADE